MFLTFCLLHYIAKSDPDRATKGTNDWYLVMKTIGLFYFQCVNVCAGMFSLSLSTLIIVYLSQITSYFDTDFD